MLERSAWRRGGYLLVTAHRAGNVDDPERLAALVELLGRCRCPRLPGPPAHPRAAARRPACSSVLERRESVLVTEPLGYLDFLGLLRDAAAVLTDSGGVQKEAYLAGVPCMTLRDTDRMARDRRGGLEPAGGTRRRPRAGSARSLDPPAERPELYGGGHAGEAIVAALEAWADGSLSYTETE